MTSLLGYRGDRRETATASGSGSTAAVPAAQSTSSLTRDAPAARNGLGTVHHVAMAVATDREQLAFREELLRYGCMSRRVRDRCYFTSIYFREPGGVLFEVATIAPGFAIDEDPENSGRRLKLPPWEEPNRAISRRASRRSSTGRISRYGSSRRTTD